MRESGEDYIETIFLLNKKQKDVHAIDIANELNFSRPSVTRAVNVLKSKGLIILDQLNHIQLTKEGLAKAELIYERHEALTLFLMKLGVSSENAAKDACRIEHVICEETFGCIKDFMYKNNEKQF